MGVSTPWGLHEARRMPQHPPVLSVRFGGSPWRLQTRELGFPGADSKRGPQAGDPIGWSVFNLASWSGSLLKHPTAFPSYGVRVREVQKVGQNNLPFTLPKEESLNYMVGLEQKKSPFPGNSQEKGLDGSTVE